MSGIQNDHLFSVVGGAGLKCISFGTDSRIPCSTDRKGDGCHNCTCSADQSFRLHMYHLFSRKFWASGTCICRALGDYAAALTKFYECGMIIKKMYNVVHSKMIDGWKEVVFMTIPNDPAILVSFLNTQLRDFYPSLEEFCKANDADQQEIEAKLAQIGYHYDETQNRFR